MSEGVKIKGGADNGQTCIFFDEPAVTFINYGTGKNYSYRKAARLHNARRQAQHNTRSKPKTVSDRVVPKLKKAVPTSSTRDICPSPRILQTPSSQDIVFPSSSLENRWRDIFSDNFYLPRISFPKSGIANAEDVFLSAAWKSQTTYRSLIVHTVATSEARTNKQLTRVIFGNQAHILRDFRHLAISWTTPQKRLALSEFQNLFAMNYSFFDSDFARQGGYAAMMSVNAAVFAVPENLFQQMCPIAEWLRTIMPRPGPSFDRSQTFQSIMLGKIEMLLDFLEVCQCAARSGVAKEVESFFRAGTALHEIISVKTPIHTNVEHNPSIYSICMHRILCLLQVHITNLNPDNVEKSKKLLIKLEGFASECLNYEPMQAITLFLWALVSDDDARRECHDPREKLFSWALKDLLEVHSISFEEDLAFWLLFQGSDGDRVTMPLIDTQIIRKKMKAYYEPDRAHSAESMLSWA